MLAVELSGYFNFKLVVTALEVLSDSLVSCTLLISLSTASTSNP